MIRAIESMESEAPARTSHSRFRRTLLLLMFLVMLIDSVPGMGIGVAPGLSGKNLFLYLLIILIGIRAATNPAGVRFVDLNVHVPFLTLIVFAITTWAMASIFDPTYNLLAGAKTLKGQLVDYYLFWFAFCYGIERKEDFLWLVRTIVVIMMVVSALTLMDFLNFPDLGIVGTYKGRLEGPFGAANQYGALQAFLLPLAIAISPRDAGFLRRWSWRLGILIIAGLLIATGSRGAYLATLVGAVLSVIFLHRYLDLKTVFRVAGAAFLAGTLLLVVFAIFNVDFLVERFEKTTSGNIYTASSGRIEIWTAALQVMMEWPSSFLVGYGWNAYAYSGIWKAAHNTYLDFLFEMGIVGLVIFLAVLAAVPMSVRGILSKAPEDERRIFFGFIFGMMIVIVDVFFVALPNIWPVIWIFAGLVTGLAAFYRPSYNETDIDRQH